MLRHLALAASLLLSCTVLAQASDPVALVKSGLKQGKPDGLTAMLAEDVELGFDGDKASYPKDQAGYILQEYYRKHVPQQFTLVHQGNPSEETRYLVGRYKAATGPVKVYVLIKRHQGRYAIDMMDFAKE